MSTTQFWGSIVMAGRVKTLQNKEGYLAGGGGLFPHLLTSASPPAPEPHGPPGWLERKAGSPSPMGTWGATAPLGPHAVGGSANKSGSSPNGTSRDREEDGEGGEDGEEKAAAFPLFQGTLSSTGAISTSLPPNARCTLEQDLGDMPCPQPGGSCQQGRGTHRAPAACAAGEAPADGHPQSRHGEWSQPGQTSPPGHAPG